MVEVTFEPYYLHPPRCVILPGMTYSLEARRALTEAFEGVRLDAYPDPASGGDPWTIGYGHTGPDVTPGLSINIDQADALLVRDIATSEAAVISAVSGRLTQHQFDALVDFAFNVGTDAFRSSTLLRMVNLADYAAADLEFAKWIRAAGKVFPGLVKRRAAEARWFATDDEP